MFIKSDEPHLGDFISAEVIKHIYGNYYKIIVNNSFILSAYCSGYRLKNGKYIFKLVSKIGGIKLELVSSYDDGLNISYIIRSFDRLNSIGDRVLVERVVRLYLKYNIKIEEKDIVALCGFIKSYVDIYGNGYSIEDFLTIISKGVSIEQMLLYLRDITFMEECFRFREGDSFLSLSSYASIEAFNIVDIFRSFSVLLSKKLNHRYNLDNIVFLEGASFLKSSICTKDFCFFSLPCSLDLEFLRFFLIKLSFRKNGIYSIHFSLRLDTEGYTRLKGVILSSSNRFVFRVLREEQGHYSNSRGFRISGLVDDNILEKSFVLLKRTINENDQLAEEMSNISYGLFNYGCRVDAYVVQPRVYFLLDKMVSNVALFLQADSKY